MATRLFEFTLWLAPAGQDLLTTTNALHAVGADDCSPGEHCGQPYAAFHREAGTLEDAIRTAIRDVQAAGCHAVRCEIDERQLAAY
jgi:hypothetical protein